MAEPDRIATANTASSETYRPLSTLGLAAFGVALLFAAVIGILGIAAFSSGSTLFLGVWVLGFPVLGLILALAARAQIRRSEGTLGGEALVSWAWWLSVVSGVVFAAYYFGTYFAVELQARTFTEAWMAKVRDGKIVDAFLDAVGPAQRKADKNAGTEAIYQRYDTTVPNGPPKSLMHRFANSDLVQFIEENGPATHWRFLGVKNWEHAAGYRVILTYEITTPTGLFEFEIPVQSSEGKEFEGRQWTVLHSEVKVGGGALSELGQSLQYLRVLSHEFALNWLKSLHEGKLDTAYLATLDPGKRSELERAFAAKRAIYQSTGLAGLAADLPVSGGPANTLMRSSLLLEPDVQRSIYLEGYEDFIAGNLLHFERLESRDRDKIIALVKTQWPTPWKFAIRLLEERGRPLPTAEGSKHVRIASPVELRPFDESRGKNGLEYVCIGNLVVESDPGPLGAARQPQWRVVQLDFLRGSREKPGPPANQADAAGPQRPARGPRPPR
jgi:hypothetical protein